MVRHLGAIKKIAIKWIKAVAKTASGAAALGL